MPERIVVNTGPLIALAKADALDVVGQLPFDFVCPRAVRDELDEGARLGHQAVVAPWVSVVALSRPVLATWLVRREIVDENGTTLRSGHGQRREPDVRRVEKPSVPRRGSTAEESSRVDASAT